MKMIIENEWQYRYIIDFLERERNMLNELRSSHMTSVSSCLPELSSAIIPARIDKVRNNPKSVLNENAPMEGVVARPECDILDRQGKRVIVKIKVRDFE